MSQYEWNWNRYSLGVIVSILSIKLITDEGFLFCLGAGLVVSLFVEAVGWIFEWKYP